MAKVNFQIEAPGAAEVFLAGDFNDWSTTSARLLKKQDRACNGLFGIQMQLDPGKYEFKYLVDGQWVCDLESPRVQNPFGTENSVCVVEEKPATRTKMVAIGAK
jgi:1,4-alpha-glucan branching enzyme